MKIALQFAMPSELHALPGARELAPLETVSGVPIFEIAPDILACAGGVSKVNAAMAAELLCLRYGVDLILNAGVAGCFTDLPTGTLVVASEFVQHDVDTTAVGDPIGLVSTVNQVAFPTWQPERCAELLASLGYPAVTGRVSTGDWFAVKGQRAEWIRGTFSPLLTEMEGGAIAQVCLRNGVRFGEVRLRPPVLRQPGGGVLRLRPGPGGPGPGGAAPGQGTSKSWQIENGAPGGDDPRRALVSRQLCSAGPSGSTVNTSSMGTPNTLAMFQASTREGLYRPFSRFPMVSRRTPTSFASSSCFRPRRARCSFIRLRITAPAPSSPGSRTRRRSGRRPPQRQPSQPCSR